MFAILFVLAGAALLAIASGLVVGQSTSQAAPAEPGAGQSGPAIPAVGGPASDPSARGTAPGRGQPGQSSLSHQLFLSSLIALGIMAVAAALLGWVFAGRALRPLRVDHRDRAADLGGQPRRAARLRRTAGRAEGSRPTPSTGCWSGWKAPSRRSAGSSPTPRTSCARRWLPCAPPSMWPWPSLSRRRSQTVLLGGPAAGGA